MNPERLEQQPEESKEDDLVHQEALRRLEERRVKQEERDKRKADAKRMQQPTSIEETVRNSIREFQKQEDDFFQEAEARRRRMADKGKAALDEMARILGGKSPAALDIIEEFDKNMEGIAQDLRREAKISQEMSRIQAEQAEQDILNIKESFGVESKEKDQSILREKAEIDFNKALAGSYIEGIDTDMQMEIDQIKIRALQARTFEEFKSIQVRTDALKKRFFENRGIISE